MASNIGWELYRSFLSVLKEGSLSAAARALGTTQPTVGRHIEALEQALGIVLFTRSQSGLAPTEIALAIRGYAEAVESTVASLERAASSQGNGVAGVVRVTASDVIGVEVLPAIITRMREQYPDIRVELVLSDRVQDLLHREADIAVRMVQPKQEQLVARRIGSIELGFHAHTEYLRRHGNPRTTKDLAKHSIIGYDLATPFVHRAGKSLPDLPRKNFALASDSNLAQFALIRSGAGIGVCQVTLAKRDPALTRVLAKSFSMKLETWVTMHEDLRNNPRCRVVFDALVEGMLDYVEQS
ncbi:LysR family transcriptional regulator [Glaciimonas soli]|uniref:LysR family transcriptional regulator n=1 Tax=Glaciimonas soli TaxID=2590999 RepID=A0A843YL97_9BURK|nr:LysR family transcriptional regulator [Glaciimonas soli]MQR00639.1 LysR family transcriptional regulator [Glaciimonas soli]